MQKLCVCVCIITGAPVYAEAETSLTGLRAPCQLWWVQRTRLCVPSAGGIPWFRARERNAAHVWRAACARVCTYVLLCMCIYGYVSRNKWWDVDATSHVWDTNSQSHVTQTRENVRTYDTCSFTHKSEVRLMCGGLYVCMSVSMYMYVCVHVRYVWCPRFTHKSEMRLMRGELCVCMWT